MHLVPRCISVRTIKAERRNLNLQGLSRLRDHDVVAFHNAGWSRHRCPACIPICFAWREHRLLSYNARASNFLHASLTINNSPESCRQFYCLSPIISDAHPISPKEVILARIGFVSQIERINLNMDSVCVDVTAVCFVHADTSRAGLKLTLNGQWFLHIRSDTQSTSNLSARTLARRTKLSF